MSSPVVDAPSVHVQNDEWISQWRRSRRPSRLVVGYVLLLCAVVAILFASVGSMEYLDVQIRRAEGVQLDAKRLLELQIDQETGVRGYHATGITQLLQPFAFAQQPLSQFLETIGSRVADHPGAAEAIADFSRLHQEWLREVAWPIIRDHRDPRNDEREERSKTLVDRMRTDVDLVQALHAREQQQLRAVRSNIRFLATGLLLFTVGVIGLNAYVGNRRSLRREEQLLQTIIAERDAEARRSEWRTKIIAMLAHDFRSSLAVIRGYADLLESFPEKRSDTESYEAIRKSVEELTAMSEEALLMARLSNGAINVYLRPAPIYEIVCEAAQRYAEGNSISIEESSELVMGDRPYLVRVFDNLLSNAVKYSQAPAKIEVRFVRRGERDIEIVVADHGEGIDAADLPRVFEEFWRAGSVGERSGTGIGLYIVRKIIDAHGGAVSIESKRGEGTSVRVVLPAANVPSRLVTAG